MLSAPLSPACSTDGDWRALHAAPRWLGTAAGSGEPVTARAEGLEVVTHTAILSPKGFMDSSPSALCKYW